MKAIKIETTIAANIKKFMIMSSIEVTRCRQNGIGISIEIKNDFENKKKAELFFAEFDLTYRNGSKPSIISISDKYIDYGTLFRTTTIDGDI